jgi:transcriptional regulator with PAS, ATPase and Fis domain
MERNMVAKMLLKKTSILAVLAAAGVFPGALGQAPVKEARQVLGPDALARLCAHQWPGNVRELQNAMAALVVLAPARGRVGARHVNQVLVAGGERQTHQEEGLPLHRMRATCEQRAVAGALARHGGRRALAARELGLTRQGLSKAMKRLGLDMKPETAGVA